MSKLFLMVVVGVFAVSGCGQQQEPEKPATQSAQKDAASADELQRRALKGSCTRVRTYDEIKRGVPCK